jgi:hypothetical protein
MKRVLIVMLVLSLALSGCSGGKKKRDDGAGVLPPEITEEDVTRLEHLTSKFPTAFKFPGQAALAPTDVWFNDTLAPGTAATGVEEPADTGHADYGSEIIVYDLASYVPVGQPVEVRVTLKWWGDPGAAADLDIWANVPGDTGAYDPTQNDESMNWNIITEERILDAVHVEGQPFEVGIEVNNGRIVSKDVPYTMHVEFYFVEHVLPPGVAYLIHVPADSSILVVDTERVVGDEHVDLEMVLIGPNDQLVRHLRHNDIGQETLSLVVPGGGDYIVYAQHIHGGFLRLEAEVPNEQPNVTALELVHDERVLFEGPAAPGTYVEQGPASSNSFGATGAFDVGPTFPLDITPFMRNTGGAEAAINVTSPNGWTTTQYNCNYVVVTGVLVNNPRSPVPYCVDYEDERGRIGARPTILHDRSTLDVGAYTYGIVANGPGITLGVDILTYTR